MGLLGLPPSMEGILPSHTLVHHSTPPPFTEGFLCKNVPLPGSGKFLFDLCKDTFAISTHIHYIFLG